MELFDKVEDVHDEQDGGHPEGSHAHKHEPLTSWMFSPVGRGRKNAYKADQIQYHSAEFEGPRDGLDVPGIEADVGLHMGLGHSLCGLKIHPAQAHGVENSRSTV